MRRLQPLDHVGAFVADFLDHSLGLRGHLGLHGGDDHADEQVEDDEGRDQQEGYENRAKRRGAAP